jgi:hypothetical protein
MHTLAGRAAVACCSQRPHAPAFGRSGTVSLIAGVNVGAGGATCSLRSGLDCDSHAEALAVWVEAAAAAQRPTAPYAVLHVDQHSDMNLPSSVFTATPAGHFDRGADPASELQRLAPLRAAAVREADLASFQMAGVWAGVVSSIVWVHGNSSEPFLLTPTGELEAKCAGLSCPLREWLQSSTETGYFTLTPRQSSSSYSAGSPSELDTAVDAAWQSASVGTNTFSPHGAPRPDFNQAPLLPSAPFDFWIGHIDHPKTISNAYWALTTPPDVGGGGGAAPAAAAAAVAGEWVLDIDLDAFMPTRFSHRVRLLACFVFAALAAVCVCTILLLPVFFLCRSDIPLADVASTCLLCCFRASESSMVVWW